MSSPMFKFTKKDFSFPKPKQVTVDLEIRTLYESHELAYYLTIVSAMERVMVIVNKTWVSEEMEGPTEEDIIDCVAEAIVARNDYARTRVVDMRIDFIDLEDGPVVCRLWIKLGVVDDE